MNVGAGPAPSQNSSAASNSSTTPSTPQSTSTAPTPAPTDNLYNSPQGWAVRAAGGYGDNIPGGPATGPWSTTRGARRPHRHPRQRRRSKPPRHRAQPRPQSLRNQPDRPPSPCDDGSPQDQSGHGTWTASLAAGALGPTTGNVAGVAPQATILNIKVLERMPAATGISDTAASLPGRPARRPPHLGPPGHRRRRRQPRRHHLPLARHARRYIHRRRRRPQSRLRSSHLRRYTGRLCDHRRARQRRPRSLHRHARRTPRTIPRRARHHRLHQPRLRREPHRRSRLRTRPRHAPLLLQLRSPPQRHRRSRRQLSRRRHHLRIGAAPSGATAGLPAPAPPASPNTTDGLPANGQSLGCFNLGHSAYVQAMGTSASAALAAGAAAILRAARPDLTATQIVNALRSSATSLPTMPEPQLNLAAALATF